MNSRQKFPRWKAGQGGVRLAVSVHESVKIKRRRNVDSLDGFRLDVSSCAARGFRLPDVRSEGNNLNMSHLMELLISAVVILVGLFVYNWLANNASSPLAGKI